MTNQRWVQLRLLAKTLFKENSEKKRCILFKLATKEWTVALKISTKAKYHRTRVSPLEPEQHSFKTKLLKSLINKKLSNTIINNSLNTY